MPLDVAQVEKDSLVSTEGHAIRHLQTKFPDHLILHDEHTSVGTVLYACLMAHYLELGQHLSRQDRIKFEDRRYLIGFDLWNFDISTIEHVCAKIMETTDADFDRGFALAQFAFSAANWTPIPRQTDHRFHGKSATQSPREDRS